MMNRREKMLFGLGDLQSLQGVEIGALDNPLIQKSEGPITYVDFTDAETLKKKYAVFADRNMNNVVDVDVIWGPNNLSEALGNEHHIDYVIASHVIEHVPDLIGWLKEVQTVLKEGGTLRLAIPDRRYTFDIRREVSRLTDVVHANILKARMPLPYQVIDFELNFFATDARQAWEGSVTAPRLTDKARYQYCLTVMEQVLASGEYWDSHCWVFTPLSFATLMEQLAYLDLMPFSCDTWFDTEQNELEFIVNMRIGGPDIKRSWARMVEELQARQTPPARKLKGMLRKLWIGK